MVSGLDWLGLVRCNGVPAERLHRIGALETAHAPNHSAVLLSFGLRSAEMREENLPVEDFHIWSEACQRVKTASGFVEAFGFQTHPAILEDRDRLIAQGSKIKPVMARHAILRQVFYRGDMHSMFHRYQCLSESIKEASARLKQDMQNNVVDPFQEAKGSLACASVKRHAVAVKYVVQHFQETCDENALYCLPAGCVSDTLEDVFKGAGLGDPSHEDLGIQGDTAVPTDTSQAPTTASTVSVFRV